MRNIFKYFLNGLKEIAFVLILVSGLTIFSISFSCLFIPGYYKLLGLPALFVITVLIGIGDD